MVIGMLLFCFLFCMWFCLVMVVGLVCLFVIVVVGLLWLSGDCFYGFFEYCWWYCVDFIWYLFFVEGV